MRTRSCWYTVPLLAVLLFTAAGLANAKKRPKPPPQPPPPLTEGIYYGSGGAMWVMDGSGRTRDDLLLGNCAGDGLGQGRPSYLRHGGKRWFLQVCATHDGFHPDGRPYQQLFASDDGGAKRVQLTFDTSVGFSRYGWKANWKHGDLGVSYVAHRWGKDPVTNADVVIDAGVYAAPILFDGNGEVIGLVGTPILMAACSTRVLGMGEIAEDMGLGHAWSPDGLSVVTGHYGSPGGNYTSHEIRVTHVSNPYVSTLLATGGSSPDWSANNRITFTKLLTIEIMDPGAPQSTTVVSAAPHTNILAPRFSPDGKSIVYTAYSAQSQTYDIFKTSVSKPRAKNLRTQGTAYAWR